MRVEDSRWWLVGIEQVNTRKSCTDHGEIHNSMEHLAHILNLSFVFDSLMANRNNRQ